MIDPVCVLAHPRAAAPPESPLSRRCPLRARHDNACEAVPGDADPRVVLAHGHGDRREHPTALPPQIISHKGLIQDVAIVHHLHQPVANTIRVRKACVGAEADHQAVSGAHLVEGLRQIAHISKDERIAVSARAQSDEGIPAHLKIADRYTGGGARVEGLDEHRAAVVEAVLRELGDALVREGVAQKCERVPRDQVLVPSDRR